MPSVEPSTGLGGVTVTFPEIAANVTEVDCAVPAVPAVLFSPVIVVGDNERDGVGLIVAEYATFTGLAPVEVPVIFPVMVCAEVEAAIRT